MEYGKNCFDTSHAFGLLIHFTTSIPKDVIRSWDIWLCIISIARPICRSIFENQKTWISVSCYDMDMKYNLRFVRLNKSHLQIYILHFYILNQHAKELNIVWSCHFLQSFVPTLSSTEWISIWLLWWNGSMLWIK